MRYFTPERLLQLQDRSNEQRFLAALDEWEVAIASYRKRLQAIETSLPAGLRRLISEVPLHDARIIDILQEQKGRCAIILRPEAVPIPEVVLTYTLVEPVLVLDDALSEAARSQPLAWLYDEVDVEPSPRKGNRNAADTAQTFRHSILLSNGWEVRLHFRRVTVTRPVSLLRRDPDPATDRAAVSRSA